VRVDPRPGGAATVTRKPVALETMPTVQPSTLGEILRVQAEFRNEGFHLGVSVNRRSGGRAKGVTEESIKGRALVERCSSRVGRATT